MDQQGCFCIKTKGKLKLLKEVCLLIIFGGMLVEMECRGDCFDDWGVDEGRNYT